MEQLTEGVRIVVAGLAITACAPFLIYVLARIVTLAYFMSKADYQNRVDAKRIKSHG
jgi:hypothetical protein